MGLGPSIIPRCQSECCDDHTKIKYVYITDEYDELPKEIRPWWWSTSQWNNRTCFWACNGCYDKIPDSYKHLFIYYEEYRINSK